MKRVELLAPAGDFECLKQAVWAKANAVYFGAKNFNARAKANNFGEDLSQAVAFCHLHGVRAYLTLNTLMENGEAKELLETAKHALECGIDAFIVQDFGVLNLLKNCFKNVEIHASTQMAVNNYLGAIKAQELGIKRVVLSRETSIEDIKLIKQKTNLEIEYFIQGALCVCFSGNCYLSSKLFGKSGNKGECLQPCRLPYKAILKDKEIGKGYLLSAKDLCMANRLKELACAGVDSFKIEGRLRRSGYVAGVVREYRKIIDNNFDVNEESIANIKKAFNRGDFCEGYLNGNGNIIDKDIQGHKGVKIGEVVSFEKGNRFNIVAIKSEHKVNKGDGLKFIKNGKEIASMSAIDIKQSGNIYKISTTVFVENGANVYLILDSKKEEQDLNMPQLLPIDFKLIANANKPICLEYEFKNVKGCVCGEVCQTATKLPLTKEDAKAQLEKLGNTSFVLNNFEMETTGVFVRKQELNTLRRSAVENVLNTYSNKNNVEVNYDYLEKLTCEDKSFKNNLKNNEKTLEFGENFKSDANFYVIKPQNYLDFKYEKITHGNAYLYVPSFLRNEDIKVIENILNENKNLGVYAENIGALTFNRKTILGAKLNIKNVFAIQELINENVKLVHVSPENFELLKEKFNIPILIPDYKNFELMTLTHCPIKNLFNESCGNCKYKDGIVYKMENGTKLKLKRTIVKNCYFTLSL